MAITPIFFDSVFIVALHNNADQHHDKAIRVMEEVLAEFYPYARVLTDFIMDEAVTYIKDRGRNTLLAIEAALRIKEGVDYRLELITPEEFQESYLLFVKLRDKGWSFTDCTSYIWMKKHGVKYAVSMDADFDQFDIAENLVRRL